MISAMATLKELREQLFMSQEDLAKRANVTVSTINRLENGRQKPRFVTIRKIAKALDVKPEDIHFDQLAHG